MSMSSRPWDIYADQLFPVGYGHPLWFPEQDSTSGREVHIGDVGWLRDGQFRALFNSRKAEGDPIQQKGVPRDFQAFDPPNLSISINNKITQQMVFSRSIRATESRADVAADAGGLAPGSVGGGWDFQTTTDAGALLVLDPPGVSEYIESKRHIVNYMRENFDTWFEFANSTWGLDLREHEIIFVSGTIKTTQWAVAAFQGNMFRKKQGYISGQLGSFGNVGLSIQISDQLLPTSHCRTGPSRPNPQVDSSHRLSYPDHNTPSGFPSPVRSECLFIHYFKMKRRLWWKEPIEARAGPHQLPPGPDNRRHDAVVHRGGRGSSPYEFESEAPARDDAYDPVSHLLDYIFLNSEAEIAIASDLDVIALFRDRAFPYNIFEGIQQLSPFVELDENGVGTISVDYSFVRKRRDRDEETAEEELGREEKRGRYYDDESNYDYPPMAHSGDPQQAYGTWDAAGPSAVGPYDAIGEASYHPQAPQGMYYEGGVASQTGMEYAQYAHYQQGMQYGHGMQDGQGMQHAQGMAYPQDPSYSQPYMPQQGIPQPGYGMLPPAHNADMYAPPGMPSSSAGMDQDFAPQYAPLPVAPEAPMPPAAHGGTYPPPLHGHGGGDDDDDDMGQPGEKAAGKRPVWGAPTSVHEGSVTALAYSADGQFVASGSEDTTVIIWDARENSARHKVPLGGDAGHADTISALAFSRDNAHLASASHDEEIVISLMENGREHRRINLGQAIHSLAYTPDNKYLIGGASDGTLFLWDAQTYAQVRTLNRNAAVVTFIVFSPDESLMATGGTESVCTIWETANLTGGEPLHVLDGHRGMVCAAAFASDNRRIITASDDGSSSIWNAQTGEELVILHEHSGPVWTVAFSPDGKRVASGSSDSTVKVCDSFSGERQLSLDGHDSMINAVEFSPDGRYIASAASDNTVRLWNAGDGSLQTTYNEHNDNVTTVMFASDGSTLASGSHDGTVRIRALMVA